MLKKEFGTAITNARVAAKLRQSDLAKRVGMHPVTLSRLENGDLPETLGAVLRIFDELGLELLLKEKSLATGLLVSKEHDHDLPIARKVNEVRRRVRKPRLPLTKTALGEIPRDHVRQFIMNLARQHGVRFTPTPTDALAEVITGLADDEVKMDEVERLLLALERAGVVASETVVPLHVNYLREKLNVRPVQGL